MSGWSRVDGDMGGSDGWTARREKHIPVKQGLSRGEGAMWEQGWGDVQTSWKEKGGKSHEVRENNRGLG